MVGEFVRTVMAPCNNSCHDNHETSENDHGTLSCESAVPVDVIHIVGELTILSTKVTNASSPKSEG